MTHTEKCRIGTTPQPTVKGSACERPLSSPLTLQTPSPMCQKLPPFTLCMCNWGEQIFPPQKWWRHPRIKALHYLIKAPHPKSKMAKKPSSSPPPHLSPMLATPSISLSGDHLLPRPVWHGRGGWCKIFLNQMKNYSRLNLPVTREGEYWILNSPFV